MKIDTASKIERACSTDQARPALCDPYLRIGKDGAWLEATNSYVLARVPVEVGEGDTQGHVPLEAVKAARKRPADGYLEANGACKVPGGPTFPRPDLGQFPNTDQLLTHYSPSDGSFVVGLNAKLLWDLAQALGSKDGVVHLMFAPGDVAARKPIEVRASRGVDGAHGLLMPVRVG